MLVSGAYVIIIIIYLRSGAKSENREPLIVVAKQICTNNKKKLSTDSSP